MNTATHWSKLELTDGEIIIKDQDQILRALAEFRDTGCMYQLFFTYGGNEWEKEDDASTWGPEVSTDVDWTGLEAAIRKAEGQVPDA